MDFNINNSIVTLVIKCLNNCCTYIYTIIFKYSVISKEALWLHKTCIKYTIIIVEVRLLSSGKCYRHKSILIAELLYKYFSQRKFYDFSNNILKIKVV